MRAGSSRFAVLLGAGASFGAVDRPYRPPLGADLFEALAQACPNTWGALSDHDKEKFQGPDRGLAFESGMAWLWERDQRGELAVQDLITDMAVFFASFQLPPGGDDCYSQLLRVFQRAQIIGPRLGIATLNYECLLELAAGGLHIPVDPSPVMPQVNRLTAWKPHGACNLIVQPVATGNWKNIRMSACGAWVGGNGVPLVAVHPEQVRQIYEGQHNVPPAMSLYAPGKSSPVAPEQILRSRECWTTWSRSSDVTIIVGARPNLDDEHVWRGLLDGSAQVWFIGDPDSAFTLSRELGDHRVSHLGDYFAPTLASLVSRITLLS